MSSIQGMINSIKQNRALMPKRKSFKSRKNEIFQNKYQLRTYSEEEKRKERDLLESRIEQNRRFKIIMLFLILLVTGILLYSLLGI